jgi:hypothetical protein
MACTTCPDRPPSFPTAFCCRSGEKCIYLAENTTLLCCPTTEACMEIKPIPCDLSLQDASRYPNSSIKSTVLTGQLPRCGASACCPWGYGCRNNKCEMNGSDESPLPAGTLAAIVVSCFIGLLLLSGLAYWLSRRRVFGHRRRHRFRELGGRAELDAGRDGKLWPPTSWVELDGAMAPRELPATMAPNELPTSRMD